MSSDSDADAVRDRLVEQPADGGESPLTDAPAGVRHPARRGGRVTDVPVVAARLTLTDETLLVRAADGDLADFDIRLADIIYLRDGQQEINGEPVESLVLRHIDPPADAVTTKVSLWDADAHDRLTTVVTDYYRQHREAVAELELSTQQLEVLVTAYSAGREFDPASMLPKAADDIAAIFDPLRRADLLREGDTGVFLTGRGHMVVNETLDDETM
jgi:helix-turn-helix protein